MGTRHALEAPDTNIAGGLFWPRPARRNPRLPGQRPRWVAAVHVALSLLLVVPAAARTLATTRLPALTAGAGQEGPPAPQPSSALARLDELAAQARTKAEAGDGDGARTALQLAAQAAAAVTDLGNETHCRAVLEFALLATRLGEARVGLDVGRRVLGERKGHDPARDPCLLQANELVGWALAVTGDQEAVLRHFEATRDMLAAALAPADPDLFAARLRVGLQLSRVGRVAEAITVCEAVLAEMARALPDDDVPLNQARAQVGALLGESGDPRSLTLLAKALDVLEQKLPADDPLLRSSRIMHGVALLRAGDFARARLQFEQALQSLRREYPEDHPLVMDVQGHLMVLWTMQGDDRRALAAGEHLLTLYQRTYPPGHPSLLELCINVSAIRSILGDTRGAEVLLRRVVAACEDAPALNPRRLAWALTALGGIVFDAGDSAAAVAHLERARAIQADVLPADHPDVLRTLQVLACAQADQGDVEPALELAERVRATFTEAHPQDWYGQFVVRSNLAQVKRLVGDHAGARALQALPPELLALGEEHPDVIRGRAELGATLLALGERAAAAQELRRAVRGFAARLNTSAEVLSPAATESSGTRLDEPVSELLSATAEDGGAGDAADDLECVVMVRGHSERRARFAAAVHAAAARDESVRQALQHALASHAQVRELRHNGPADAGAQRDAELAAGKADEGLAAALAEHEGRPLFGPVRLADLRERLPAAAAALVTATYARISPAAPGDRGTERLGDPVEHVCCFLVTRSAVQRIELGPAELVARTVNTLRYRLRHGPVAGAAAEERHVVPALDPVLAALPAETRELLVCPDGVLATIPWEVIPRADGTPLGSLQVTYADNLTVLAPRDGELHPPSLLAVGGVDYDADLPLVAVADGPAPGLVLRAAEGARYPPLPGAHREVVTAAAAFAVAHRDGVAEVLSGASATRARFVTAAPRFRFLHLATHADAAPGQFWRPSARRSARAAGIDRGLLARLTFAGANQPPAGGVDNCMLTASEIAELDLSRCELAVLSGCDTNVGERWFGEALTGLNRALQVAGVRHTITSLWKVRDDGAHVFFAAFYDRLWRTAGTQCAIADALAHARAVARSKGFGPEVWACFVHYGDLAQ